MTESFGVGFDAYLLPIGAINNFISVKMNLPSSFKEAPHCKSLVSRKVELSSIIQIIGTPPMSFSCLFVFHF